MESYTLSTINPYNNNSFGINQEPKVNMNVLLPYKYETLSNAIQAGNYTGNPTQRYLTEIGFQNLNNQNSFTNQYLKPALGAMQSLGTLGSLWLGFQQYGIAKKQLGLAKEQWDKTKEELDRIKAVRQKITDSYMNS